MSIKNPLRITAGVSLALLASVFSAPAEAGQSNKSASVSVAEWEVVEVGPEGSGEGYDASVATISGDVIAQTRTQELTHDFRCWNGSDWEEIEGVTASDGTEVDATGLGGVSCSDFYMFGDDGKRWHWKDNSWDQGAATGHRFPVRMVNAFAPDDIWATSPVGEEVSHFDGDTWTKVSIPAMDNLDAVVGTSKSDLWILGEIYSTDELVAYHWNGVSWNKAPMPVSSDEFSAPEHATATADGVYVFGTRADDGYLHWDGESWQHAFLPEAWDDEYVHGATHANGTLWLNLYTTALRLDDGAWTEAAYPQIGNPCGSLTITGIATDRRSATVFGFGSIGGECNPQSALIRTPTA
ncbi:hypothetical protein ABZY19_38785 [Streptomyces sp. NPDC006475]|uniref:hypothetical protein n=1 Tax=Streptomyces sp. NPDC006475 TaxID=3155719 RepID=UPI0033BE1FEF